MKLMKMLKNLKWLAVWTATWTMLITPVAMGEEANRVSKSQMQHAVDELGLNRQMTIGEFYQKNKGMLPERIKKEIEPFFMANKNMMMPSFEVISSKNTAGEEIPTLRITSNGELLNIQWYGEKNRMMKFQNTNLSEVDVINFNDMFTRITAGDEKFRKQASLIPSNLKKAKSIFKSFKYPTVTKEQWKTMSAKDRATYVVNYRSLYLDAVSVLEAKAKNKAAKKKFSLNLFESHPYFAALFFGNDAEAKTYYTAKSCVVAGYLSVYEKRSADGREVCSTDKVKSEKSSDELFSLAQQKCTSAGPTMLACNPAIYGAPGGQPICISTDAGNFQQATHFGGPCDSASRLQSSSDELVFLNNVEKTKGRYDDENLLIKPEDREKYFKEDQGKNLKLTEDYMLGVLKLKGLVKGDKLDESVMNEAVLAELNKIKSQFDETINQAVGECRSIANTSDSTEKNYWKACDQLHRRFLFVQEWGAKRCTDLGQVPAPSSMACRCPGASAPAPSAPAPAASAPAPAASAPATPPPAAPVASAPAPAVSAPAPSTPAPAEVPPGASCPPRATASSAPAPAVSSPASGPMCDADPSDANCSCPGGGHPRVDVTSSSNGQTSYSCPAVGGDKSDKDKNSCGFFCKMWKGVKTIAPFAIAGVAAYFIFKMLSPKKPALVPAADMCPGTNTPPPCAQTCTPPLKLQSSGACSCDGCPPGQTADATCTCSSTTPGGTTPPATILCPDSVSRAADLNACPDYPCWNGSSYKNPMNCPAAPASTTNSVNTGN